MLELVEQTEVTIDEVIQVMGRATIEAVLEMSAEGVAGVKQAGRSRAEDDTVPAGWCGLPVGPEGACGAATAQAPGRWGGWRGRPYAAMRRPGAVADGCSSLRGSHAEVRPCDR